MGRSVYSMSANHTLRFAGIGILVFYMMAAPLYSWIHLPRFLGTHSSVATVLLTRCEEYGLDCSHLDSHINPAFVPSKRAPSPTDDERKRRQTQILSSKSIFPIDIEVTPLKIIYRRRTFNEATSKFDTEIIRVVFIPRKVKCEKS